MNKIEQKKKEHEIEQEINENFSTKKMKRPRCTETESNALAAALVVDVGVFHSEITSSRAWKQSGDLY